MLYFLSLDDFSCETARNWGWTSLGAAESCSLAGQVCHRSLLSGPSQRDPEVHAADWGAMGLRGPFTPDLLVPPVANSQTLWTLQWPSQTGGGLFPWLGYWGSPSCLPLCPRVLSCVCGMGFYSHNLKTWVSVCTLCWNENFACGKYHIGGYLNFTGIHVISKKMYLLGMSSYFCTVVITCFRWVEIYQKGLRKRSCCFYSCCLMSLFSLTPGHATTKLERTSPVEQLKILGVRYIKTLCT